MRRKVHVRFGGRVGETGWPKSQNRPPDSTLHRSRGRHAGTGGRSAPAGRAGDQRRRRRGPVDLRLGEAQLLDLPLRVEAPGARPPLRGHHSIALLPGGARGRRRPPAGWRPHRCCRRAGQRLRPPPLPLPDRILGWVQKPLKVRPGLYLCSINALPAFLRSLLLIRRICRSTVDVSPSRSRCGGS